SLAAFERYQTEQAETWEHLALLRARVIAGPPREGREALERVRARMLSTGSPPWAYLAGLRRRGPRRPGPRPARGAALTTGPGGLMDVGFLAEGAVLERGACELPVLPSIPGLLRAAQTGARVESLARDYAFLRRVESRARWLAGRAVEIVGLDAP